MSRTQRTRGVLLKRKTPSRGTRSTMRRKESKKRGRIRRRCRG